MIKFSNVNSFVKKTKKQQERITQGATNFTKSQVQKVLKDLVLHTPQFTGNTAAMWRVETINIQDSGHLSSLYVYNWKRIRDADIKFIGDSRAWVESKETFDMLKPAIRYNSRLFIVNNSPIADDIAQGDVVLRPGNFIPNDYMAVKYATAKYRLSSNIESLGV